MYKYYYGSYSKCKFCSDGVQYRFNATSSSSNTFACKLEHDIVLACTCRIAGNFWRNIFGNLNETVILEIKFWNVATELLWLLVANRNTKVFRK